MAEPVDLDLEAWPVWLAAILPGHCTAPFAPHHQDFWTWLWAIEPGIRPEAGVGIWSRGGAKSTSAEAGCVSLGARKKRRYGLYVCGTQDRADDHVGNVGSMLESERVELFYPDMASRRVGKYGNSRGWRRNRLWTASGFVLDAIGLDTAARGVKLDDQRPDFMVLDEVDSLHDTPAATRKKIETLTQSVIPAGATDLAILAIQNLVKADGVFDRIATGRAEFLRRRVLWGPIPAIEGLAVKREDDGRDRIVSGEATWAGQSIERCQEQIDDWGLPAFLREAQHEVANAEGALWSHEQIAAGRGWQGDPEAFPEIAELVVSVDSSGGSGDGHDDQGIIAVGRGIDGHGYVLADWTCSLSPMGWGKKAVNLAVLQQADEIIVEGNYGGEMNVSTIHNAADALVREGVTGEDGGFGPERFATGSRHVHQVSASGASKEERAAACASRYEQKERPETWAHATVHHVGTFPELEREQCTWEPGGKSPNRVDALAHAVARLNIRRRKLRAR